MREFWDSHKKGILGFLGGAFVMVGMVTANIFCNRLPPPFAQICVGVAQEAVNTVKNELANQGDGGVALAPAGPAAPQLELCPGAPDGDCCTSNGYALPSCHCRCR